MISEGPVPRAHKASAGTYPVAHKDATNHVGHKPTIEDGDYKTDVKEVLIDDYANDETDDEKNAQAPDAAQYIHDLYHEGGHTLLKPRNCVVGGDLVVTWVQGHTDIYIHTFSVPAAVENYETNPNMELLQHQALSQLKCPEDSMGSDIVHS